MVITVGLVVNCSVVHLYHKLPNFIAILCLFGIVFCALLYVKDQQKLEFRATDGKCVIWGKPAKLIRAQYVDDFGKTKRSILLTSGFWGITRHMNYTSLSANIDQILWRFLQIICPSDPFKELNESRVDIKALDTELTRGVYPIIWTTSNDGVSPQVVDIQFVALFDTLGMPFHHKPPDVSEKEAPTQTHGVGICALKLVVRVVVQCPVYGRLLTRQGLQYN
ncbi:unnamed protein product [Oppiella nova]|uniref:Uncharacterized protein n=1 Tax=Oppiella nova TaxID=334625 RepID=A0A7R9QB15_9ACAR|nr:unnamed protein product [Oppiella nova]CAG2161638.1 unnamed protein product [Oppiella nova]